MPYLPISTLALHKIPILVCITQHLLIELGDNLAMCQWEEGQLVSNTDVVCAIPCSVEFKDSSMHALLALVFGQQVEWFTLSNQCESQFTYGVLLFSSNHILNYQWTFF